MAVFPPVDDAGPGPSHGLPGPAYPQHRERAHETNRAAEMQQREQGEAVLLVVVAAAPFAVILFLFLTALLRCEQADIPAVMQALAALLKALTRRGGD